MKNFNNKLAFIIGGSEGIGLATAQLLVERKSNVVIFSRNQNKLKSAFEQLTKYRKNEKQIIAYKAVDITQFEQVESILESSIDQYGTPDILMNTAGIAHPAYLDQIKVQQIQQMIDVNLLGPIYTCKVLLPHLLKKSEAYIVNVSSVAGYVGLFGYTAYCGSKFGIVGFSEALQAELAQSNVKVSVLCPANTKTPGLKRENLNKPEEILAMEEKVKVLEPHQVAEQTLKKLGSFWIIPTVDSQMAYYLKRFSPKLLKQFTKRRKRQL